MPENPLRSFETSFLGQIGQAVDRVAADTTAKRVRNEQEQREMRLLQFEGERNRQARQETLRNAELLKIAGNVNLPMASRMAAYNKYQGAIGAEVTDPSQAQQVLEQGYQASPETTQQFNLPEGAKFSMKDLISLEQQGESDFIKLLRAQTYGYGAQTKRLTEERKGKEFEQEFNQTTRIHKDMMKYRYAALENDIKKARENAKQGINTYSNIKLRELFSNFKDSLAQDNVLLKQVNAQLASEEMLGVSETKMSFMWPQKKKLLANRDALMKRMADVREARIKLSTDNPDLIKLFELEDFNIEPEEDTPSLGGGLPQP